MGDVLINLANEAMWHSSNHTSNNPVNDSNSSIDWIWVLKGLLPMITIALGFATRSLMDHFFLVMTTLAEVESPIPGGVNSDDMGSEKYGLLEASSYKDKKGRSAFSTEPHYVTSSLRATIRLLSAEAGELSMFRGIGAKVCIYTLMIPVTLVCEFLAYRLPFVKSNSVAGSIAGIAASLISCQMWAGLLHIIMSKQQFKFWFRRLPLSWFSVLRQVWLAVLLNCLSDDIVEWAFGYFAPHTEPGAPMVNSPNPGEPKQFQMSHGPMVKIGIAILLWAFVKSMLRSQIKPLIKMAVLKPIQAIEGRVLSSMLPDDADPIIPIDRSFQGRPQSGGILQQQPQPLSFMEAARTINKKTYLRLLKLEIKMHFISQFAQWAFWTLLFAQVIYFIGPSSVWLVLKLIMGTPIVEADLERVQGNATRAFFDRVIADSANYTSPAFNVTFPSIESGI
ncbi:hypothetical protein D6C77_01902 [Aureobasidium pullulans]|uniref:Uncharacterized protein n=1 Tax=Aureobasidium pullulans TaxID=5580 RepID=A0A4S9VDA8_AURPU|nr:hypothetical protein D6C90_03094 [Aureobasidium pullulans]TIA63688.1 hypothetical protein D6C77_01902 [Aureobasidium pullulans]